VNVLVFQHVAFEGLGQIEPLLRERGANIRWQRWYDAPSAELPGTADVDLLIVMGGPMSVHDESDHPWLPTEKKWIRTALDAGVPMLGICLGAQLIAESLGGRVERHPEPEIGWFPIELTEAGQDLFGTSGGSGTVLHWHGESYSLPPGAERLASSAACGEQGFRLGQKVVGLQFHLEMRPEDLARLIEHSRHELLERPWVQRESRLRDEPAATYSQTHQWLRSLLDGLWESVTRREETSGQN